MMGTHRNAWGCAWGPTASVSSGETGLSFFLAFFHPASVKCACKHWIHSEPRLLQTQVTPDHICLKNTPKYTFRPPLHTTKSSMPPPLYLNHLVTWRLTSNLRMNHVDYRRFHAVSSGYRSISDGAGSAALMRSIVGTRQPGWNALERNLYRHFSAIWSFFYTRILITKYFPRESLRWRAEIPSSQRFLQLYCASH